ncbi:MAG: hypothetical protein KG029_11235 [Bacteroidetes bacterium]|nr:hypothetical protein [Bacteroidota bacterium]
MQTLNQLSTPSPSLKLSQMASIRNGEIPVVVVYVRDNLPSEYQLVAPEEAVVTLAAIERLRDLACIPVAMAKPAAPKKSKGAAHE